MEGCQFTWLRVRPTNNNTTTERYENKNCKLVTEDVNTK